MSKSEFYLGDDYSKKTILAIIDRALSGRWQIYFLSRLTDDFQALTKVQLMGIAKFGRINIKLETGQTYQVGLEADMTGQGTYQEIGMEHLIVDEDAKVQISKEFESP